MSHTFKDDVEDLDIVMQMYSLLEFSQNYCLTSGSLSHYYREEIDDVDDNASDREFFKYKTETVGKA